MASRKRAGLLLVVIAEQSVANVLEEAYP